MTAHEITCGFMPLLDSALVVVAAARGFAEEEGVALRLARESSWANIRDRLALGHFQVAQMLAPMPVAGNLGLTPLPSRTVAPFALGLGGNAVTVCNALWERMRDRGARDDLDAAANGAALAAALQSAPLGGRSRFAVVHPYSGHNYELRYWLASSGVDPEKDIEIVVLPPSLLPEALATGVLSGYCVGEPWNTAAVKLGVGHIATVKANIWRSSPEKVLGAQERWANQNPEALAALLRALYRAGRWCADSANRDALATLLAKPAHVGQPAEWMLPSLSGDIPVSAATTVPIKDFFLPLARGATFPWKSHALWFYTQMARWGQVEHSAANEAIARETYRPDLYRAALRPLGVALPAANYKVEGALKAPTPVGASGAALTLGPDGFFDGRIFDPDRVGDYIEAEAVIRPK